MTTKSYTKRSGTVPGKPITITYGGYRNASSFYHHNQESTLGSTYLFDLINPHQTHIYKNDHFNTFQYFTTAAVLNQLKLKFQLFNHTSLIILYVGGSYTGQHTSSHWLKEEHFSL